MTVGIRLIAAGVVACLVPIGVAQAQTSTAPAPKPPDERGLSANAAINAPNPRNTARIISGRLPNGGQFVLPPAGRPPFPIPGRLPGLPGSRTPSGVVDGVPSYSPQTSCSPGEKPGITGFKKLVLSRYPSGRDWGSSRNCSDDGISEHLEGRAWDWNVDVNNPLQFAHAAQLLQWLTANKGVNARRLGIMYIGYNYRIWGAYRASEGWRVLSNSNPHTDHVHFSFSWNGAMKNTSFWAGKTFAEDYGPCRIYSGQPAPLRVARNVRGCRSPAALPAPFRSARLLWRGSTGPLVTKAQVRLGVKPATGFFGPITADKTAQFQRARKLPVTGAVDARTWFALGMNR